MTPLKLCKCLADETRLKIAAMLWYQDELCVCDIVDRLALPQPTVSRHLAQLRACGVLTMRKDSRWVYYSCNKALPEWARQVLEQLAAPVSQQYRSVAQHDRCACN